MAWDDGRDKSRLSSTLASSGPAAPWLRAPTPTVSRARVISRSQLTSPLPAKAAAAMARSAATPEVQGIRWQLSMLRHQQDKSPEPPGVMSEPPSSLPARTTPNEQSLRPSTRMALDRRDSHVGDGVAAARASHGREGAQSALGRLEGGAVLGMLYPKAQCTIFQLQLAGATPQPRKRRSVKGVPPVAFLICPAGLK